MAGAWTMTEDGEFILNEPYASMLREVKHLGAIAWQQAVFEYLVAHTDYSMEFIYNEFSRRCTEENLQPVEIVDEFVIEALEGNL